MKYVYIYMNMHGSFILWHLLFHCINKDRLLITAQLCCEVMSVITRVSQRVSFLAGKISQKKALTWKQIEKRNSQHR